MADLLDIAPSTAVEAVRISGGERLVVHGLNSNAIAAIVARFPELVALLGGGDGNFAARLLAQFGAAMGPIIAAGCGHLANDKAEAIAGALLPEDQLKLVSAIYRLTFPNGLAPVMEAMTGLVTGAIDAAKPVKVRLRKSPLPSPPSSGPVSHPNLQ